VAHEKSVTIRAKAGGWVNVKSVYKGKTVSADAARKLFETGKTRRLGGKTFTSNKSAVRAAKARSNKYRTRGIR
jgi:hypothetical protein